MNKLRMLATILLLLGVGQAILGGVALTERPAVQVTSYSKLVEMEKRGLLSVPEGNELSFVSPAGNLGVLHEALFPESNATSGILMVLPVLGIAVAIVAGLMMHLTREQPALRTD